MSKKLKPAFKVSLAPYSLTLCVLTSYDGVASAVGMDIVETSQALTFAERGTYNIYVAFKTDSPEIDLIVHELFHVCTMLAEIIGHNFLQEDEPMAYLIGHMTKEVLKGLAKAKAKKLDKANKLVDNA